PERRSFRSTSSARSPDSAAGIGWASWRPKSSISGGPARPRRARTRKPERPKTGFAMAAPGPSGSARRSWLNSAAGFWTDIAWHRPRILHPNDAEEAIPDAPWSPHQPGAGAGILGGPRSHGEG